MESTVPTSGVDGFTPEQFEASGQKATVNGDTLVIAAQSKKGPDVVPITDLVTYQLKDVAQPALTFTGALGAVYQGGLNIVGSTSAETLTFGSKNVDEKTRVRKTNVDLSGAGAADKFVIASVGKTVFKKTRVTISDSTEIKTNKGAFTSEDLNAKGKIKGLGLGGITFDVV